MSKYLHDLYEVTAVIYATGALNKYIYLYLYL